MPVAVQLLRWHMLDNNVSALAFRSMDQIFTTRTVARGGPVWNLARSDRPLDFTYSWQGGSVPAEQFLEGTYTNALLVVKDGRIVSEIYRNNSDPRSRFIGWSATKSITSVLIGCSARGRPDRLARHAHHAVPAGTGRRWVRRRVDSTRDADALRGGLRGARRLREPWIDPATRTVIVKLSYFPPGDSSMLEAETFAFMAAASAWQAR